MKKITTLQVCFIALGAVINIAGGWIALALHLPIYLDCIGTILVAALLGSRFGMLPSLISGVIGGLTDIYAFYFLPVGMITGIMAGILFRTVYTKRWRLPLGALAVTIPGTLLSSCITAFVFGGVTSSASSALVLLLDKLGMGLVVSTFLTQIATDYLDRCIAVFLVCAVLAAMSTEMKGKLRGEIKGGTI